jgi:hypothetical protein
MSCTNTCLGVHQGGALSCTNTCLGIHRVPSCASKELQMKPYGQQCQAIEGYRGLR